MKSKKSKASPADDAPKSGKKRAKGEAEEGSQASEAAAPESSAAPEVATPQDRLLRLQADFDNFRKRVLREKADIYKRANEDLILEMLPVLDHMDMALESARTHEVADAVVDGFRLVSEQLQAALEKSGLVPVEAAGQPFDPQLHEAISVLASEDVPDHGVIMQIRRGYVLGGKLLRPAQVVVSSGPAVPSDGGAAAADG